MTFASHDKKEKAVHIQGHSPLLGALPRELTMKLGIRNMLNGNMTIWGRKKSRGGISDDSKRRISQNCNGNVLWYRSHDVQKESMQRVEDTRIVQYYKRFSNNSCDIRLETEKCSCISRYITLKIKENSPTELPNGERQPLQKQVQKLVQWRRPCQN